MHVIGAELGSWALTIFHYNRRGLILALEERTYLTLVFEAAPRDGFRRRFSRALADLLKDLGIADGIAEHEAAILNVLPLTGVTNRRMAGSLNNLVFLGHCELDYTSDLRRVQLNLNEVPHAQRDPCVPMDAVRQLFAASIEAGKLVH